MKLSSGILFSVMIIALTPGGALAGSSKWTLNKDKTQCLNHKYSGYTIL